MTIRFLSIPAPLTALLLAGALCGVRAAEPAPAAASGVDAYAAAACRADQQAAASISRLRELGRPKDEVVAMLRASSTMQDRTVRVLRQVADDVFDHPEIEDFPYFVYRSEACLRESRRQGPMPTFDSLAPAVARCQARHGSNPTDALIDCVRAVVRQAPSAPARPAASTP